MSDEITRPFPHNHVRLTLENHDSRISILEEKLERKLMETQPIWSEVLNQIGIVTTQLDAMDQRISLRFDGVDSRLDRVESRLDAVENRLGVVESRLDAVENRLGVVENRLDKVENRLGKVEYELYNLGKKFRVLNREILDGQNAHEDLEERVATLENSKAQENE